MMKKTTQNLLLVFSTLLLLVSVTVSAQGQPTPRPTPQPGQDRFRGNAPSFVGTWNTVTDKGKKIVITLESIRSRPGIVTGHYNPWNGLTGSYKPSDGSIIGFVKVSWGAEPVLQDAAGNWINGTVTDNVLRFTWRESPGSSGSGRIPDRFGAGRFTLSADGESFEGTYSMTNNPDDTSGGTWNGTRAPNFAGAWRAKLGDTGLELIFQQTGDQVTGQVRGFSYDVVIRDGKVVGNTLRFTLERPDPSVLPGRVPRYLAFGSGELVMDRGSKSFTGTFLGAATSGTLLAR
jgi:hypothetical protein